MFNNDTWLATSLVTHNWELLVFGPLLAMLSTPRPVGQKQETLTDMTNYPPTQTHVKGQSKNAKQSGNFLWQILPSDCQA